MNFTDLKNLALKSRTAHAFDPKARIDEKALNEVIELCLLAPNHKFTYPWKILKVGPQKREGIANLAVDLAKVKGADEEILQKTKDKILNPSELLVFTLKKKPGNSFEEREDYATLSCSIQLLALGLQSLGFHYKWSTGGLTTHPRVYEILEVDSQCEEIIGFVWVGKAVKTPVLRERPRLEEVVRQV